MCCREALVRAGFLSLQLLVNDFLPILPDTCVARCIQVTGGYGLQRVELNISLTAVGLLVSGNVVLLVPDLTFCLVSVAHQ